MARYATLTNGTWCEMNDTEIPCYIARCKCGCGALVFASVDEPNQSQARLKDTAKEVAKLVCQGYTIDRMSVGEVRASRFTCTGLGKGASNG